MCFISTGLVNDVFYASQLSSSGSLSRGRASERASEGARGRWRGAMRVSVCVRVRKGPGGFNKVKGVRACEERNGMTGCPCTWPELNMQGSRRRSRLHERLHTFGCILVFIRLITFICFVQLALSRG